MIVQPFNWVTWLDARYRMPEVWSGWKFDRAAATLAMVNCLRRGNVPVRGVTRTSDLWESKVEAAKIAPGLMDIADWGSCKFEVSQTCPAGIGQINFPMRTFAHTITVSLIGLELAWDEFKADLIQWELPTGVVPEPDQGERTAAGTGRLGNTIPEKLVIGFFEGCRNIGEKPAADASIPKIQKQYPDHHVPRYLVRQAHRRVFGQLRPGKR